MPSLKDRLKSIFSKKKPKTTESAAKATDGAQNKTVAATAPPPPPASLTTGAGGGPVRESGSAGASGAATTSSGTLQILLQNQSNSSNVYAYITGQALARNNALFLLQADAKTPYYPPSPSSTGAPVGANISIPLGAPGNTVTATIPYLAGARIWFCQGDQLTFLLNPGPGLVEPSVFNQSDPNINKNFGFCEFTFNSSQLFANISYVDFVSGVPIALTLKDASGASQHVSGMRANGLQTVCNGLTAQSAKDNRRWKELIVTHNNAPLRALSPNSGITLHSDWFQTYWQTYVNEVWQKYAGSSMTLQTQSGYGNLTGRIDGNGLLDFGNGLTFARPSAKDIFSNSTGPFATGSNPEINTIIPRLAAAFNRSTLLFTTSVPDGANPSQYYQDASTNHYARIVHAANVDGLGYAFPYDDVTPDGGKPQEGAVQSGSPVSLTVTAGGNNAYAA